MKLKECYIENFGGLSNFKLSFSDGLNSVIQENGYGKTTLTVFIKAMLFGLDDTKKARLELNDRKHYTPWQGGRYGGSLTLTVGDGTYRIERTFGQKAADDTFKLYDCKSGKESAAFTSAVGEELFGIDADGFERTVFLSELNLSGKNDNKTVSAKLSDLSGCEGDLGGMDEAVELLEKQRKFYHKRGGSGEIGDIKRRISALDREINDILRLKDEISEEERRHADIIAKLAAAEKRRKELFEEAKRLEAAKLRAVYEKQFSEMKSNADRDAERLKALDAFFGKHLPTVREAEEAKEYRSLALRIAKEEAAEGATPPELAFFSGCDVGDGEFENARTLLASLNEAEKEAELLKKECRAAEEHTKPTASEAEAALRAVSVKRGGGAFLALTSALVLAGVGILLGIAVKPVMYALCATSVIPLLLYAVKKRTGAGKASLRDEYETARRLIAEAEIDPSGSAEELVGKLHAVKLRAERAERELSEARARLDATNERLAVLNREACEFIAKFPDVNSGGIVEAVTEILKRRDVYSALTEAGRSTKERQAARLAEARRYAERAQAFIAQFPTVTDRPFDEITERLAERTALSAALERQRHALMEFAARHGINADAVSAAQGTGDAAYESVDYSEVDLAVSELERAKAVSEKKLREGYDEIARMEELEEEKAELTELEAEYEKKLDVIRKTMEYLVEAKDALTSRYLSKTKDAFDRYVALIGKENGEDFQLDTSFSVKKNERGVLRAAEAYSRGTRDMYALVSRFALIDSLYENEKPFIILDDPFAYFDDERLRRAAGMIKTLAKERQIIYLSCTGARKL